MAVVGIGLIVLLVLVPIGVVELVKRVVLELVNRPRPVGRSAGPP